MTRQTLPAEISRFNRGLVTEASPLTFPDNASLDEDNMVLNKDGSRRRRLGIDIEDSGTSVSTTYTHDTSSELNTSSYKWENAGGDPQKSLIVIQVGNVLKIFDLDTSPLSSGLLYTHTFSSGSSEKIFSYAVVDGILVVASGVKDLHLFTFDAPSTITVSTTSLLIRDFFGVEDFDGSDNLKEGSNIEKRPTTLTDEHTYNLRNQTFALPRLQGNQEIMGDPITYFYGISGAINPPLPNKVYPSNADNLTISLFADPADAGGRTAERFFPGSLISNSYGSIHAPIGYFIIDALQRGTSRLEEEAKLRSRNPVLNKTVLALPLDETPGGPSVITEFAGRVFYSGFDGTVIDGDSLSPRMSSYVLFSQLVNDPTNINKCYQSGDPTSVDAPDIIDIDGGFIRIDDAYSINSMTNVGNSLLITAKNGVWRVYGNDESGFKASNYTVSKISDHGCEGAGSVVRVDNTIMFWGDDGIYVVSPDEFGAWRAYNISQGTIQTFYDSIPSDSKVTVKGVYDSFETKVRWVYDNSINNTNESKELIFDVALKAFYKNTIKNLDETALPRVVDIFQVDPFQIITNQFEVVNGVDGIINGADNVIVTIGTRQPITRELNYLIIRQISGTVSFSFGSYKVSDFYDWKSIDGTGVDAEAYMITGYLSGGDFQRGKQVPYLTTYMKKTETGYEDDGFGNLTGVPASSCLVQAQWEWSNSASSGRWGREFQIYRHRRHYIPASVSAPFDDGFSTVVTRNKIRGGGRVVSFKFRTEAGKDLHLYGWSMLLGVEDNV